MVQLHEVAFRDYVLSWTCTLLLPPRKYRSERKGMTKIK